MNFSRNELELIFFLFLLISFLISINHLYNDNTACMLKQYKDLEISQFL